ncbi:MULTISPECIES: hypothetical protein [Nocardia]|uniref:hypothetical protein n=1 Tax=Nocardia TaxID=1817 RepID=UPI0012D84350|nr:MULTISPECIES: hypothetical protein [Nocardia]MBF6278609.1 hypothetical protein [Nocardia nova]
MAATSLGTVVDIGSIDVGCVDGVEESGCVSGCCIDLALDPWVGAWIGVCRSGCRDECGADGDRGEQ